MNEKIAFVVDGRVASAPVVMERIPGGRAMLTFDPAQRAAMRARSVSRIGAQPEA